MKFDEMKSDEMQSLAEALKEAYTTEALELLLMFIERLDEIDYQEDHELIGSLREEALSFQREWLSMTPGERYGTPGIPLDEIVATRGGPPQEAEQFIRRVEQIILRIVALTKYEKSPLGYGDKRGLVELRQFLADRINEEALYGDQQELSADNILSVGSGGTSLLNACAALAEEIGKLENRKGIVALADQTYDRTRKALMNHGVDVINIPIDEDGIDVYALEVILKDGCQLDAVYVIPNFQNPTGVILSLERRYKLAVLATKYNFLIFEDDPYGELGFSAERLPTLRNLAPGRTIHMNSFSKTIAAGFRVAYAVTSEELAGKLEKILEDRGICSSVQNQAFVLEFLRAGLFEGRLEELKELYASRLEAIIDYFNEYMKEHAKLCSAEPDGGFFISMYLSNPKITTHQLLKAAKEQGIILSDGRGFGAANVVEGESGILIRIPFATLHPQQAEALMIRLAEVIVNLEEQMQD